MGAANMPVAEIEIDEAFVRRLLAAQHPDLAGLELAPLASGWDNVIYRLGGALTVRLPRRTMGGELMEHELRWLPELAPGLPLPTSVALRRGRPDDGYPWSWAIGRWLPGTMAALSRLDDPGAAAQALGTFLAALHRPAPADAPTSAIRGVPLAQRAALVDEHLDQVADQVDAVALRARWDDLVATDVWPGPPVWVHGDLHPANLLVDEGALSAVIDWGDMNAGDPATDLAVAWMLLPAAERGRFRDAAGIGNDLATWRRARGWAIVLGVACLANSADNDVIAGIGRRTLAAVLADDERDD